MNMNHLMYPHNNTRIQYEYLKNHNMNPHPDSVSYVLIEGTAGFPAEGLLLGAIPHLPPAHLGAGERVEAAGLGRP